MKIISISALAVILVIAGAPVSSADDSTTLVRARLPRGADFGDLTARGIEILSANGDGTYDMVVTGGQLEWLLAASPLVDVLDRPMHGAAAELDENLGLYHTYDEMLSTLEQMVLDYPDLAILDTIGTSHEGRAIVALKISDNVSADESETEVFIAGCHHARELMSVEVPLLFAQYLLSNYGVSPFVTSMVDTREIWVAPMVNPDGHVYVQNNHSGDWWNWWRKNRRDNGDGSFGVDLNRNYGHEWGYDDAGSSPDPSSVLYRGPYAFSEPETRAVRDFCLSREFSVAVSYHTYGELIIHPWGYDALMTEDHELFTVLGDSLSRGNGYRVGCTATHILYPVNGDSDDWMYGETASKSRIFGYTVEMNTYAEGGFGPPDSLIIPTFEKVLPLNLTLLSRAGDPYSVLGPMPPRISEVVALASSSHLVTWSGPEKGDPNPPVAWEVQEYAGYTSSSDPGGAGGDTWILDGFVESSVRFDSPSECYYSRRDDGKEYTMTMSEPYPAALFGDTIRCSLWYAIETGWDYAYLEMSGDGGITWITVPGNLTTTADPNGNNRGYGITGSSAGWTAAEFWLGEAAPLQPDAVVDLRFAYSTDAYVNEEGIFIDDISPVPSYGSKSVIAAACDDTFLVREPDSVAAYAYRVRAADGEGHMSRWSSLAFHTVTVYVDSDAMPAAGSGLESVYPNPFNPLTKVRYTVGEREAAPAGRAHVRLEVFDVAGRRVALLEDGHMVAGRYSAQWDGTVSGGGDAASGIYFMRLTVGQRSFSRKTVLLR
jgi:hypothetical protein